MQKQKKQTKYTDVYLMDNFDGSTYSANPADYFMMKDNAKFESLALAGTVYKKGDWHRKEIIKAHPTKKDLKKYYKR